MGQIGSSPTPHNVLVEFVNLPKDAIMSLWLSYNLLGEGWSLDLDQFISVFQEAEFLREHYKFSEDQLRALFKMFDTDANGLIDALETITTIGLVSGMDAVEKIYFAFNVYDFGSKGFLSNDETNLLFRSITKGLAKISNAEGFSSATSDDGERFADLLFQAMDKPKENGTIGSEEFKAYSLTHPVISNWLRAASNLVVPTSHKDSGLVADDSRGQWVSALNTKFVAPKNQAMAYTLKVEELSSALQEIEQQVPLQEDSAVLSATMRVPDEASVDVGVEQQLPSWVTKVNRLKPEELPPVRVDLPEDAIESQWIGGLNVRHLGHCPTASAVTDASTEFAASHMQRCVRYRNLANDTVLYTVGPHVVLMKKNEETAVWSQELFNEHNHAISALELNYEKDLLVTADRTVEGNAANRLVVWQLSTMKVKHRWELPASVKFLDVNALGTLAVVVFEDVGSTLSVIELNSGKCVFSKKILSDYLTDRVNDVRFFGTSTMIAVALELQGVKFFIDEETGIMGKSNMHLYEERDALYGVLGKTLIGSAATVIARLELPDELATATNNGHIIIWRGRAVSQVIEAQRGRIYALDYNATTKTLVSGGEDGGVRLLEIKDPNAHIPKNLLPKGPRPPAVRSLTATAQFDILRHASLSGHQIASIALAEGAHKALVATTTHELVEVTCKLAVPSPEEAAEEEAAAAAEGEEGAVPATKGQLGDDLHGGALVSSHFSSKVPIRGSTPLIASACKVGGNGFATCGNDATVRLWQPAGEGETALMYKVAKLIQMDAPCTAIVASAANLAVALFGGENAARDGSVHLFALPDGTFVGELPRSEDSNQSVKEIKCSAEGNLFAVLRVDNSIEIFVQVEGAWQLKGKLSSKDSLDRFDLSADNLFLRAYYSSTKDVKVFDIAASFGTEIFATLPPPLVNPPPVEEGEEPPPVPGAAIIEQLRGIQWASNNCPYNWDSVASVALLGESSVGIVDRSNHVLLSTLASGDITINRLPAINTAKLNSSAQRVLSAHNGAISALFFFEEGGAKILSAGSVDGVVRVWKVTYDTDEPEPDLPDAAAEEEKVEDDGDEAAKTALPVLYDSGEEEDLEDGVLLKKHLRRCRKTKAAAAEALGAAEEEGAESAVAESSSVEAPVVSQTEQALTSYAKAIGAADARALSRSCAQSLGVVETLLPTDELAVEWIYGCSSRQTRNAVRYTSDGLIVYPAGGVSIIFDKIAQKQIRVQSHRDEITALDVHLPRQLAATAHKGLGNILLFLWRTTDGVVQRTIDCGTIGGVSAIKFSPCGRYVAIAGQDADHHVSIYSVDDGVLLAKVRGGTQKVLCLAFSELPYGPHSAPTLRILVGGVKHFKILSFNTVTRTLHSKSGMYGADVRKSHVNCVAALPLTPVPEGESVSGNEFLLGMADGSVGVVARGEARVSAFTPTLKGSVTAVVVAKTKAATAEEPAQFKIVVGGTQGVIKVLDAEQQPVSEFNLYVKEHGLYALGRVRGFKSLCVDKLSRKLLYATAAGEIGEIDLVTGEDLNNQQPLVHSHFRDQLRALATHPLRQECLTAGEDKSLRVWNLETHTLAAIIELPGPAVSATFAPNGHLIVASLSRKHTDPFGGRLSIVSYLQGKVRIVHNTNDAREEITSVVFSPDGSKVFAASMDNNIYVYDALNNFRLLRTMSGHSEGVSSLDISSDGKYLVSEGVNHQVMLWELRGFSVVSAPLDTKEILGEIEKKYFVRQNLFGLNSVGVFSPAAAQASAGETAAVPAVLSVAQSRDGKLLATGDQNGQLKLFSNPAVALGSPHRNYCAHSPGGLSKTAFSVDDQFVLSIGQQDKLLVQWKLIKNAASPDAASSSAAKQALALEDKKPTKNANPEDAFENSFVVKGVNFADAPQAAAAHKPSASSQLVNIVGNGSGLSRSLPVAQYCGHGELVVAAGKAVYSVEGDNDHRKLRVWNVPTVTSVGESAAAKTDVACITVSPCGRFVLVGFAPNEVNDESLSGTASVHLYAAPVGELVVELVSDALRGVSAVSFSKQGSLAAALGRDAQHTLYVFKSFSGRWNDALLLHRTHCSAAQIDLLAFLVAPDTKVPAHKTCNEFVTAGDGLIKFWRTDGLNLLCETGIYGEDGKSHVAITAVAGGTGNGARDEAITGDAEGKVFQWNGKHRHRLLESHPSAITAMSSFSNADGSKAGVVIASKDALSVWTTATNVALLVHISLYDIVSRLGWSSALYKELALPQILNVSSDPEARQILLSMDSGLLLNFSTDSGNVRKLIEGHGVSHKVKQLVAHPSDEHLVITVCDDNAVRVWDISGEMVYSGVSLTSPTPSKPKHAASLVGFLTLPHPVTALTFVNDSLLYVAMSNADKDGVSGAILSVEMKKSSSHGDGERVSGPSYLLSIINRYHNVGNGAVHQLRLSPGNNMLASSSEDGCVYVHKISAKDHTLEPVGHFLAHIDGVPVVAADFSHDGRYLRCFGENHLATSGKAIEVNFFDFELDGGVSASSMNPLKKYAGGKVQDVGMLESLKAVAWATVGSPAAPEVRGVSILPSNELLHTDAVALSEDNKFVCAGYTDGSISVARFPVVSLTANCTLSVAPHAQGGAHVVFLANHNANRRVVTLGKTDNVFMVHVLDV